MVELAEAHVLLDPGPLPLEMGIQRLASGQLHVAVRTDMPGCTGEMFEWWFRFAPDTQQYAWWHPIDHVTSDWAETNPQTHVGSTHIVKERFGDGPVHDIHIQFQDPDELFGAERLADARRSGAVSGIVYARSGMGAEPARDAQGRPMGSRMVHICRDTHEGMVLRSRWWLDADLPDGAPPRAVDAAGLELMRHANTEFRYLAKFLPSLYIAERRDEIAPPELW